MLSESRRNECYWTALAYQKAKMAKIESARNARLAPRESRACLRIRADGAAARAEQILQRLVELRDDGEIRRIQ